MARTVLVLAILLVATPDHGLLMTKRQIYNSGDLLGFITSLGSEGAGGYGQHLQTTSLAGALASIAQYDELRCVPRLLCEVAAGGKPGYSGKQQSVIPFINQDTLLKLLNFGDTSPLVVFGRAALLGVSAQGDPGTCLSAYPTCPRDPDRLVHYLNNHNGGFFRFFNSRQHQRHNSISLSADKARITTNGFTRPDEILADVDGDYFGQTFNQGRLTFPNQEPSKPFSIQFATNHNKHTTYPSKHRFAFPREHNNAQVGLQPVPMVFPDRTGTGDLRLDTDGTSHVHLQRKPQSFFGRELTSFPPYSTATRGGNVADNSRSRLVFRDSAQ